MYHRFETFSLLPSAQGCRFTPPLGSIGTPPRFLPSAPPPPTPCCTIDTLLYLQASNIIDAWI